MKRRAGPLETVWVEVPEPALDAYEAALASVCETVGFFLADEDARTWRVEGVREAAADPAALDRALLLAALTSGVEAEHNRAPTEAEGWLARTRSAFPPQQIGPRILVRGTHDAGPEAPGLVTLTLDAGVAFGSGEHESTRGCLLALQRVSSRIHGPILDLGTGSGILAMAAAKLLHRPVLATDIEPWSVRVAARNARDNGVGRLVRPILADGWHAPALRRGGPYGLIFANILARPLCAMARDLAANLAPGGRAILAGLLTTQARQVMAAHRRHGLALEQVSIQGQWATLLLRRPARTASGGS